MLSLILSFPVFWSVALSITGAMRESWSHLLVMFVSLPTNLALRARVLCLPRARRSSGGMPVSA